MPSTPSRKAKRLHLQQEQQQPPAAAPDDVAAFDDIDFESVPGPLLNTGALSTMKPQTPKTVVTPGPLNAHITQFLSRQPGGRRETSFQQVTLALWRTLLREEYAARQAAEAETRRTGLPTQAQYGPFFVALREELQRMKDEEAA